MDEATLLRSHIVPPSHILANGQFIHLPPPSSFERSTFFERSVAENGLIDVGDDTDIDGKSNRKKRDDKKNKRQADDNNGDGGGGGGGDASTKTTSSSSTSKAKRKKKTSDATAYVHPLAMASARLRSKGMEELNKAINLSGLVMGGEYFGLTHVVDQQQRLITNKKDSSTSDNVGGDKGKNTGSGGGSGVADPSSSSAAAAAAAVRKTSDLVDDSILQEDLRLRSEYVLQRRQAQYDNASNVLMRHSKRLSLSVGVSRILDNRLQILRHKWHLVAPEHGKKYVGPIRPREIMAVDVDVYDRGLRDGRGGSGTGESSHSSLGRIARRVPRFATLELDDEYDISTDVKSLRAQLIDVINGLKELKDGGDDNDALEDMQVDSIAENGSKDQSSSSRGQETCKTKAEPFAIADPSLGKIDPDFDPDKVPLLTLLFEIEKPSTGFVERATLSSSTTSSSTSNDLSENDSGAKSPAVHPDERVIEALQHSLFCASLFESIRSEIIPHSTTSMVGTDISLSQQRQKEHKLAAWLSSEMEESFLPSPSVMAGGQDADRIGDTRLLCVIHCHEGEVKVQLDDEYSFTVKLIEAGTTVAAGTQHNTSNKGSDTDMNLRDHSCFGMGASGSQSPAQLRTLCRSMLLHCQTLYHDHCMMVTRRNMSDLQIKEETPALGFARTTKETKLPSPRILQSCVGLGCKFIFERKVRSVLKRLTMWLEMDMMCKETIAVEWLPLSLFTPFSRFALQFREVCLDIIIHGDVMRVTQMSKNGFKAVGFGSELELECHLKLEFRRALGND
ncbi:hypothetical protein ACHAXH_000974 [Discostella pseudostelligera]